MPGGPYVLATNGFGSYRYSEPTSRPVIYDPVINGLRYHSHYNKHHSGYTALLKTENLLKMKQIEDGGNDGQWDNQCDPQCDDHQVLMHI